MRWLGFFLLTFMDSWWVPRDWCIRVESKSTIGIPLQKSARFQCAKYMAREKSGSRLEENSYETLSISSQPSIM